MSEIETVRAQVAAALPRVLPQIQRDLASVPAGGRLKVLAVETNRKFAPEDVDADPAGFAGNDLRLLAFWQALRDHGIATEVVNEQPAGWRDPEPELEGRSFRKLWADSGPGRAVLYAKKS